MDRAGHNGLFALKVRVKAILSNIVGKGNNNNNINEPRVDCSNNMLLTRI